MTNFEPLPAAIHQRLRVLQHDLSKVKENVAFGRVRPEHYADLEKALDARIQALEAEVHARLLAEAGRKNARFRLN